MPNHSVAGVIHRETRSERYTLGMPITIHYTSDLKYGTHLQKRIVKALDAYMAKHKDTFSEMSEDFRDLHAEYTKALPDSSMSAQS